MTYAAESSPLPVRLRGDLVEDLRSPLAAHLDDEPVAAVEQLGQRQVERCAAALLGPGTGPHRDTEAGAARVGARDGDDEGVGPTGRVVGVTEAALGQDGVVDAEGAEVAGTDPEEGVGRAFLGVLRFGLLVCPHLDTSAVGVRLPRQSSSSVGKNTGFADCAPAANPNSASSSLRRSR